MHNKIIPTLLFLMAHSGLNAQDPQYTQFYASPMFLNPAFAGLTYEHRFTAQYRKQWPGIGRAFNSYLAAYDYNLADLNGGIGGFVWQDKAGTSNLVTTQGGLNLAYRVKIDRFSEMRGGIMLGMTQRKIDNSSLLFNDQLISGAGTSVDSKAENIIYPDLGAGMLYNTAKYWIGLTAKHINRPNTSMVGNAEPLPLYLSLHGGYRYIISETGRSGLKTEEFISAGVHYRKQQQYDQLDIGAYYFKSFLNIGLWYRGLPFKKYKPGYLNNESMAILIGMELPKKNLRIGYSYDLTLSTLGISRSRGAHEVSLVHEIAKNKRHSRRVLVSCPKF